MTAILVVDDDRDNTANLADILGALGYQVTTANDPKDALALARTTRFDIALLDFKMPGMNGADLYSAMRSAQPQMVAIMITAHAGSGGFERAMEVGTWKVLSKPIEIERLVGLMRDAETQPVVLVVDDDREFCENLWEVLRERDLRVAFAHDEATALEQIRSADFQVVLLDIKLGKTTSRNVFAGLRESRQTERTIIVTGHGQNAQDVIEEMMQSGASAVHNKPVELSELIQSIECSLQRDSA
ncbi:MAG: response regulator [Planctomycetota bacterium]